MTARIWRVVASAALLAVVGSERQAVRPHDPHRSMLVRPMGRRAASALVLALAAAGGARAHVEEVMAQTLLDMDTNGDGLVDLEEFRTHMHSLDRQILDEKLRRRWLDLGEKVFAEADLTGDGILNEREVLYGEYLKALAMHRYMSKGAGDLDEFAHEHFQAELAEYDEDGDRRLDKVEWMNAMRDHTAQWGWEGYAEDPEVSEWMGKLFSMSDVSGDGAVDAKEFQFSTILGEEALDLGTFKEKAFANQILAEFDANGDGKIDAEEAGVGARMKAMFKEADANGDNALDRGELAKLAARMLQER